MCLALMAYFIFFRMGAQITTLQIQRTQKSPSQQHTQSKANVDGSSNVNFMPFILKSIFLSLLYNVWCSQGCVGFQFMFLSLCVSILAHFFPIYSEWRDYVFVLLLNGLSYEDT